jgi:integrase
MLKRKGQAMAQVFDRGGKWYARFQHEGKDFSRSTGVEVATGKKAEADSKEQAEAELARMLAEIAGRESVDALFVRLNEALGRLPKREQEPKRVTLAEQLRNGVSARLEVAEAWDAWLNSPRKRRAGQGTIDGYRAYWGREAVKKHGRKNGNGFKPWLLKRHSYVKYLHEVTPAIAEEYASHVWQTGVAPRTYNGQIKFLRSMFKTLNTRAGLTCNPWEEISTEENDTEGRRNFTPDELSTVCAKAKGDLRYWLAIGLYTGMRLGDVVTLRWSEIDFDDGTIRRVPGKTKRKGKVVSFPLHPVLWAMLQELRESADLKTGYLFPEDAARHVKGQSSTITDSIQKHFKTCGITTTESPNGKQRQKVIVRVGFHSLRHSFVSLCAENKVPQVAIQELVGHGSPAMTALYSHAGSEQKAKAIAMLPTVSFDEQVNVGME